MARKGSLKKKPKNATETTAEGQKGQKVSFEVGGKKGSRQENRADTPGHVLDQAFLVRVNAFWKGWQHQLGGVGREDAGGKDLPCFPLVQLPPIHPKLFEWVWQMECSQDAEGTQSFLYTKVFFTSTL